MERFQEQSRTTACRWNVIGSSPCGTRMTSTGWVKAWVVTQRFPGEVAVTRSEERRVGKEWRSRWSPAREKKRKEATRPRRRRGEGARVKCRVSAECDGG